MAWCKAVWFENGREEEGVIPRCWVKDKYVFWPSKLNVLRAATEMIPPDETWWKYDLVKIKCEDDDKEFCEGFDFTTATEESESESIRKKCKMNSTTKSKIYYPSLNAPAVAQSTPPQAKSSKRSNKNTPSHTPTTSAVSVLKRKLVHTVQTVAEGEIPPPERKSVKKSSKFPIEDGKFQYKVLHLLTDILDAVNDLNASLKSGSSSFDLIQVDNTDLFEDFDITLKDPEIEKKLKLKLVNLGGANCHSNARSILLKVMSNKLMAKFNMAGKHGKKSFRKTNFYSIVMDCLPSKYSEKDRDTAIANVLKKAPDREGGGGRKGDVAMNDEASDVKENSDNDSSDYDISDNDSEQET